MKNSELHLLSDIRICFLSTMEYALILLAIGLLLNVLYKCDAVLEVVPFDTEVMVNDSTYLNCSTSLEAKKVQWRHGSNYVYTGLSILEPYNVRFSVEINSSAGTNNLVIRSVQPSDAGRYECLEDEGFGEKSSAQLIVLDDNPVCKSNLQLSRVIGPNACVIEPDEIQLSCSITYHGLTFPVLQWKSSKDNQSNIEGQVNFTSNKNNVTYTLTKKSSLDLNSSSFICQTTKASRRNYSCSSDVIKILYVFGSKVTINMSMNDEVTCYANTSQLCSYKWKWFMGDDSTTVSNDQTLKPTTVGSHRCEATCSIGNKRCNTVEAMYAEVYPTHATSGQNLLALLVIFALLVVVIIGVAIFRRWWKKHTLSQKYRSEPVLVQLITTKAAKEGKKLIKGMTTLDKKLFVVSGESSKVEAYNSMTFNFSHQWNLTELIDPYDLGSCHKNKCLYLSDKKDKGQSSEILRIDSSGKLIKRWSTGNHYGRLSVTGESNVILAVFETNRLNEYSPDGDLIREVILSSDTHIHHPLHAIKLTNGDFVVSHGFHPNDQHRVCVVDAVGKLKKSFGEICGSGIRQMDLPIYLAVDESGFVMVTDRWNTRVLLLDSDLELKREILPMKKYKIRNFSRIHLDQKNGRLFVADNKLDDPSIWIFKFTNVSCSTSCGSL